MSRWLKEIGLVALAGVCCGTLVPRVLLPPTAQARTLRRRPPAVVTDAQPGEAPSSVPVAVPASEPVASAPTASEAAPTPPAVAASPARAERSRAASPMPRGLERGGGRWVLDLRGVENPRALLSGMDLAPHTTDASQDGFVVRRTDRAGYARAVGIRPGDVLLSANGRALRSADDALDAFIASRNATRLALEFRRASSRYTVRVELRRGAAAQGG